jgi:hypothetical protein
MMAASPRKRKTHQLLLIALIMLSPHTFRASVATGFSAQSRA